MMSATMARQGPGETTTRTEHFSGTELTVSRSVIVAITDAMLRERLRRSLTGMRWQVLEAAGGAETIAQLEKSRPEALLLDSWLPDLEVREFAGQVRLLYPSVDLLCLGSRMEGSGVRSPRRNELLHAIREAEEDVSPANVASIGETFQDTDHGGRSRSVEPAIEDAKRAGADDDSMLIAEMVGRSAPMRELARLIRLVAPRTATVLIEGETGTGKEVVAKALHQLSSRAARSFTVLNCAAIPETLLEAELFGHARGAFTGAVQARTGRIEAANGGTLFLDEIGEMPLGLQAKMLRFLECGELQRVGDNDTVRVDVRVIAATHQPLEQRADEGLFRLDLYHRLAVFPIEVPALRERLDDLPLLVEFFLEKLGRNMPRKSISAAALARLGEHGWPGNVRELMHVLERGAIFAGDRPEIGVQDIQLRRVRGDKVQGATG